MWPYDEQEADWLGKRRSYSEIELEARRMRAETLVWLAGLAARKLLFVLAFAARPLRRWRERQALEAELYGMSDRELRDVGLSRNDLAAVLDGTYRDPRGLRTRLRPILVRLNPGPRRTATHEPRLAA